MRRPLLLTLLFLAIPASFAATTACTASLAPSTGVLTLAGMAGLVAAGVLAITYMVSKFGEDSQLEAWVKMELQELITAGVVVSIVYAFVLGSNVVLPALTGTADPGCAAINGDGSGPGINAAIDKLVVDYKDTIRVANRLGMVSSYFYTKTMGFIFYFGTMAAPYQGMGGMRLALTQLSNTLSNGIIVYETIKVMYAFFTNPAIYEALFSLGFALRMLPFTRKVGGMLIALGVAAIILFPYSMYVVNKLHNQIENDALSATSTVKLHSQVTAGDLDRINLKLSSFLTTMCSNDFIRIFTSLNEWGWWAVFCTPYCLVISATDVLIPWMSQCPSYVLPAAIAACIARAWAEFFSYFAECMIPIDGMCWPISYSIYNGIQTAFQLASSIALVTSSKQIEGAIGGNVTEIYDIVMVKLVGPVGLAASMPLMEAGLIGIIVMAGARGLSDVFGGDVQIAGIGRLV